jgi:hypothetical protein
MMAPLFGDRIIGDELFANPDGTIRAALQPACSAGS